MNINIALLGLGTVGSGVKKILTDNKEIIEKRLYNKTGKRISINISKILVRDTSKHTDIDKSVLTTDFQEILDDPSINIVVEVIGGTEPATDYIINSMKMKKHVVSANKMAIAYFGKQFDAYAYENDVLFLYEASVAGTIPVIRVIEDSLTANNIYKISGIINGTTNYILTKMTNENKSFEDALRSAQELGYAEADPTSDIDGYDAMYKIAILTRLAYGINAELDTIERMKLRDISADDINKAKGKGCVVKYIAESELYNGKLQISVGPKEIPMTDSLAFVDNATNAICIYCDKAGKVVLQGQGAGSEPTASAVIADILNIIERRF